MRGRSLGSSRMSETDEFASSGRKLKLVFEHRMVDLVADRVGSRFRQLARLVGRGGALQKK